MSPYLQNVLNVQKQALDDLRNSKLVEALQQCKLVLWWIKKRCRTGLAGQGLQDRLAEIQATGQQKAFEQAQQQLKEIVGN